MATQPEIFVQTGPNWWMVFVAASPYVVGYGPTPLTAIVGLLDAEAAHERGAFTHANGAPMFAPDGMMLDDQGNRSIFDDVDE